MEKKCFEGTKTMSEAICEAKSLLQEYIAPPIAGESMKVRIARAARYVGFSYSRTGTLWYGNARRVEASEIDTLREAAMRKSSTITVEVKNGKDFWGTVSELRAQIEEIRSTVERLQQVSRARSGDDFYARTQGRDDT